ncbi:MAG: glycoside hydrolase family 31 protein, partial [Clostridia bacterium]|nr:glycoside hydrolase family 31 protein [Clostridia bacterium]
MGITDIAAVYGEGLNSTANTAAYAYVNSRGSRMLMWYHPHAYTVSTLQTLLPGVSRNNLPLPLNLVNPVAGNYMGDFIDFSHPNAVNAITGFFNGGTSYTKNLKYWDLGLKGAMIDYGEWLRDDTLLYNGVKGDEMHNFISYYYAKTQMEAWDSYYPNHDYVLFQRSGTAGSQKYVTNFTGDQKADWEGLKDQIHGILSMSMGGFNIVGGDMGGFSGQPSNELYTRWVQFSAFSPLMRTHGQIKNPWDKGDVAKSSFSTYYWMRMNMQDLLYSAAIDAHKNATPMMMPLGVAYQGQKGVKSINDQYLFCNSFLVNPVTQPGVDSRTLWLPEGHWYDLWTGDRLEGNVSVTANAPSQTIPVYLKSGAAVAVELPDTMQLATSMEGKTRYKALLITPADNLTATPVYTTADGAPTVYTSRYIHANAYSVTADTPSNRRMLIAYGTTAVTVKADGTTLPKLSRVPNITSDVCGYYTDGSGKTYILAPDGWKNIYIDSTSLAVTSNVFASSVAGLLGYGTIHQKAYPNGLAYATYSGSTSVLQNEFLTYMGNKYDFYYTDYESGKRTYTKRASFVSAEKGWSAGALFINRYLQINGKNSITDLQGTALRQVAALVPKNSDGSLLRIKNFKATFGVRFEKNYGSIVLAFRQMTPAGFFTDTGVNTTQTYIKFSPDDIVLYDRGTTTTLHTYGSEKPASIENNRNVTVTVTAYEDTLSYRIMADYQGTATLPTVSGTVKISNAGKGYMALAMAGAYNGISLLSVEETAESGYPVIV